MTRGKTSRPWTRNSTSQSEPERKLICGTNDKRAAAPSALLIRGSPQSCPDQHPYDQHEQTTGHAVARYLATAELPVLYSDTWAWIIKAAHARRNTRTSFILPVRKQEPSIRLRGFGGRGAVTAQFRYLAAGSYAAFRADDCRQGAAQPVATNLHHRQAKAQGALKELNDLRSSQAPGPEISKIKETLPVE